MADRTGKAVAYALFNLEPRGRLFLLPGEPFYEGMIAGEHNRSQDIDIRYSLFQSFFLDLTGRPPEAGKLFRPAAAIIRN